MTFPRPLSDQEQVLVRWMLQHGESGAEEFLPQLDDAVVSGVCDCGCASVDFQVGDRHHDRKIGMTILSDYLYGPESPPFGAFVFAHGDTLGGLGCLRIWRDSRSTTFTRRTPSNAKNNKRTRRSIQRRATLLFEFGLPSPPWMSYYVRQLNKCHAFTPAAPTHSLSCLLSVKHRLLGERYDRQEMYFGNWLATNTHRFL